MIKDDKKGQTRMHDPPNYETTTRKPSTVPPERLGQMETGCVPPEPTDQEDRLSSQGDSAGVSEGGNEKVAH